MKDSFLPVIPTKTVISIRIDDDIIAKVDKLAKKQNMSRNELIKQSIVFALERIDKEINIENEDI